MDGITAWRESPLFTRRERAAFGRAEKLTRIVDTHAPAADYAAARR